MATSLVYQPLPHEGESLHGYLLRVANGNGYTTPRWLADVPDFVEAVTTWFGTSLFGRRPKWFESGDVRDFSPSTLSERSLLGSHARYCPECLLADGYWHFEWELIFYTACSLHRRVLVDQCLKCKKPLAWTRSRFLQCNCGAHLLEGCGQLGHHDEVLLCHQIGMSLAREARLAYAPMTLFHGLLHEMSVKCLVSLISTLGGGANLSAHARKITSFKVSDLTDARRLVCRTAYLLGEWPRRFQSYVRDAVTVRKDRNRATQYFSHKARFSAAILVAHQNPELTFLLDAYRAVMREGAVGTLDLRHSWANAEDREQQQYLPLVKAAKRLSVSLTRLRELFEKGHAEGFVKAGGGKRTFIVIDKASLVQTEAFLDSLISRRTASRLLGISDQRVGQLADAELLPSISLRDGAGYKRLYQRHVVIKFGKTLSAHVDPCQCSREVISMETICRIYLESNHVFLSFIRAIQSKQLRPVGMNTFGRGIGALVFSVAAYNEWQTALAPRDRCMTIVEAAQDLGVKQEVAYHLVRCGVLSFTIATRQKKRFRVISPDALDAFRQRFVSSVEIAQQWNTSPTTVVHILLDANVRPVVGPSIDGCRQYFFDRADVDLHYGQDNFSN